MKSKFYTIVALLLPVMLIAQPTPPPNPGLPPGDDDVPIDNAIIWLLVLGVAFGVYTVFKQYRKTVKS